MKTTNDQLRTRTPLFNSDEACFDPGMSGAGAGRRRTDGGQPLFSG